MAGQQVEVLIPVKKAAWVAHGNRGDEMVRRWDGQTLESRCVSDPIRRSPDRCRNGELLERFQVFAELPILSLRPCAASKLQNDHFTSRRTPLGKQMTDLVPYEGISSGPQRMDPDRSVDQDPSFSHPHEAWSVF